MKKLKKEKGITLVALIITIVVLLILAIVAIGAVRDSKIITHAQNAGDSYTISQEKEQLGLALSEWNIERVIPGKNPVFKNVIAGALQGQIQPIVENADGSLTITFNKTGNSYTVTKEGEIIEVQPENPGGEGDDSGETDATISLLEQYLFGDSPDGKSYLTDLSENGQNYKENTELGIVADDIKGIGMVQLSSTEYTFYIEYEGAKYKFKTGYDGNMPTNTIPSYGVIRIDDLDVESRVGKYVKDENNNIWRIIYDDETHGLQMISANTYGYNDSSFNLGYNDTLITDWNALDTTTQEFGLADLNGNKSLDDGLEKSIYSYNQAVETLNTACENLFKENGSYNKTYIQDVRCVGTNPIFANKNSENTTPCTSADVSVLATWPKNDENHAAGLCDGKGYSTDNNFETDFDRMIALGINKSDTSYWLASRVVYVFSDSVNFSVRCVGSDGFCNNSDLWYVGESGAYGSISSDALRPVVSLSSGIQFTEGTDGTEGNPYTF